MAVPIHFRNEVLRLLGYEPPGFGTVPPTGFSDSATRSHSPLCATSPLLEISPSDRTNSPTLAQHPKRLKKERLIFPFPGIEGVRKLCTRVRSPFRKLPVNADNFKRHIRRITHTSGKIARSSCRTGTPQAPFKPNPSAATAGAEESAACSSRCSPAGGSTIVAAPAAIWCPLWAPPEPPSGRQPTRSSTTAPQRTAALTNASADRRHRIQQPKSQAKFQRKTTTAESGRLSPPDTGGKYLSNTDLGQNSLTGK